MKYCTFLIMLLIFSNILNAQKKEDAKHPLSQYSKSVFQGQRAFKVSVGKHNRFFADVNYCFFDQPLLDSLEKNVWTLSNQNLFFGVQGTKTNNDFYLTPKLGFEYNLVFASVRVSLLNNYGYKSKKFDHLLLLEPGITLVGILNVHYGYALKLSKYHHPEISRNRITFSVNLIDVIR